MKNKKKSKTKNLKKKEKEKFIAQLRPHELSSVITKILSGTESGVESGGEWFPSGLPNDWQDIFIKTNQ